MTERPWMLPVTADDIKAVLLLQEDESVGDFFALALAHVAGDSNRPAKVSALMRTKELVDLLDDQRLCGLVQQHENGDVSVAEPLIDLAATHPMDTHLGLRTPAFFAAAARLMEARHG